LLGLCTFLSTSYTKNRGEKGLLVWRWSCQRVDGSQLVVVRRTATGGEGVAVEANKGG